MSILTQLLKKRGIKDTTELSNEEKRDFDRWNQILSKGEMSVEKILEFCKNQKQVIENQWTNLDNDAIKNERLVIQHTIYSKLIAAIVSPQSEREALEKHLQDLIKNS